jgi:hypothetical protein
VSPAPSGIPVRRFNAPPIELSAGLSVNELKSDVQKLSRGYQTLLIQVANLDQKLAKRINELLLSGTLAERPAPGIRDRIYFATDQPVGQGWYWDTGTTWAQ